MERFIIDFKGHIELDKNDLKIQNIDNSTGNMVPVDPTSMTSDEIVGAIRRGEIYISFMECYAEALDGTEEFEVEVEKDEDDEDPMEKENREADDEKTWKRCQD